MARGPGGRLARRSGATRPSHHAPRCTGSRAVRPAAREGGVPGPPRGPALPRRQGGPGSARCPCLHGLWGAGPAGPAQRASRLRRSRGNRVLRARPLAVGEDPWPPAGHPERASGRPRSADGVRGGRDGLRRCGGARCGAAGDAQESPPSGAVADAARGAGRAAARGSVPRLLRAHRHRGRPLDGQRLRPDREARDVPRPDSEGPVRRLPCPAPSSGGDEGAAGAADDAHSHGRISHAGFHAGRHGPVAPEDLPDHEFRRKMRRESMRSVTRLIIGLVVGLAGVAIAVAPVAAQEPVAEVRTWSGETLRLSQPSLEGFYTIPVKGAAAPPSDAAASTPPPMLFGSAQALAGALEKKPEPPSGQRHAETVTPQKGAGERRNPPPHKAKLGLTPRPRPPRPPSLLPATPLPA